MKQRGSCEGSAGQLAWLRPPGGTGDEAPADVRAHLHGAAGPGPASSAGFLEEEWGGHTAAWPCAGQGKVLNQCIINDRGLSGCPWNGSLLPLRRVEGSRLQAQARAGQGRGGGRSALPPTSPTLPPRGPTLPHWQGHRPPPCPPPARASSPEAPCARKGRVGVHRPSPRVPEAAWRHRTMMPGQLTVGGACRRTRAPLQHLFA